MGAVLAAQVLRNEFEKTTEEQVKTALAVAIHTLYIDAIGEWTRGNQKCEAKEYLGLTDDEWKFWVTKKGYHNV